MAADTSLPAWHQERRYSPALCACGLPCWHRHGKANGATIEDVTAAVPHQKDSGESPDLAGYHPAQGDGTARNHDQTGRGFVDAGTDLLQGGRHVFAV